VNKMKRYLETAILTDPLASHKMAFISGPRQCGKTTLAQTLLQEANCRANYFNWDDDEFRKLWFRSPSQIFEKLELPRVTATPFVVFDELHKFRHWKRSLKGLFDLHQKSLKILVTGSAKLNIYRKSGDSLAGRYIPYRLHPFTYGETNFIKPPPREDWVSPWSFSPQFNFSELLQLGGFPEPLLGKDVSKAQRWWRLYREQLVREDLRDIKAIRDVQLLSAFVTLLAEKVGGGFSFQSLQEDLSVSFATVRDWTEALETIFLCFRIRPFSKRIQGSLKKEPKLFFYHWPAVQDPGARLENLVACHLLKSVHAWTDSALGDFDLVYIRDKHKREVDFCITESGRPWLLLEVKSSTKAITPALAYYTHLLKPKFSIQLQEVGTLQRVQILESGEKVIFIAVDEFLSVLN